MLDSQLPASIRRHSLWARSVLHCRHLSAEHSHFLYLQSSVFNVRAQEDFFYVLILLRGCFRLWKRPILENSCVAECLVTSQEGLAYMDLVCQLKRSRDSADGIATGYGLDDRGVGVRVTVVSRIFSSPHRPDGLWSPPNLLFNGYRGLFPRG
jgi:hypothetical protein